MCRSYKSYIHTEATHANMSVRSAYHTDPTQENLGVQRFEGPLAAGHMCLDRVETPFGGKYGFQGIEKLKHIAFVRVPIDLRPMGYLTNVFAYGNRLRAMKICQS